MSLLLDLIYVLLVCLGWPYLVYRRLTRGPASLALRQRLGNVPDRKVSAHCVWVHGVSLGEINAARTLVAELHRRSPGTAIAISSTTQTGYERAVALFPDLCVFRFPLDFSITIRRVLRRLRPSVIVLMELEVWPNLIEVAEGRGIPVVIANGRVTEGKSMRRFRKPLIRSLARRMFGRIRWVGAQDQTYADRFIELGVPAERVQVTGSMKYDAAEVADRIDGQDELAEGMGIDASKPLWVCGSTGPGEESLLLDAYETALSDAPTLQLAIVPRKPERFDEVAALIVRRGFACLRRSSGEPTLPAGVAEPRPVFLGDTLGELRKFYALSAAAFVGRSLVPLGGSDVMEVAALAKPVLVGTHTENFAEPVELLLAAGGCRVVGSSAELAGALVELLGDFEAREKMGCAGRATILSRRGATQCTVDRILDWIQ